MIHPPQLWNSWCVFLGAQDQFDRFVGSILPDLPVSRNDWFFIRYGAGGPHLRVRVRTSLPDQTAAAEAFLRHNAEKLVAEGVDAVWRSNVTFPGGVGNPPGTVCVLPYEAEVARYGGSAAIAFSETLFCSSSRLASRAVAWADGDPSRLFPHAVDMMIAVAATLFDDPVQASSYFNVYAAGWGAYLRELGRTITEVPDEGWPTSTMPIAFRKRFGELRDARTEAGHPAGLTKSWLAMLNVARRQLAELAAREELAMVNSGFPNSQNDRAIASIGNILGSHMHMMNNRLGFSPFDEMRWAKHLASALAED